MQHDPRYDDVVSEVRAFLEERLAFAVAEGVPEERIWLDPGIGFGKTVEHNLELLRRLDEIVAIGRPGRDRHLAQELPRQAHGRPAPRPSACPARSPRTCSPWSAARACSASTTSLPCWMRSRWPLLRWRLDVGA